MYVACANKVWGNKPSLVGLAPVRTSGAESGSNPVNTVYSLMVLWWLSTTAAQVFCIERVGPITRVLNQTRGSAIKHRLHGLFGRSALKETRVYLIAGRMPGI